MGYAAEALALALLIVLGWRTCRTGAGSASHAAIGAVLALLSALLVAWASDHLVARVSANLLVRLVLPLGMSVVAFALIRRWWRRDPRRREAWSASLRSRPTATWVTLALVVSTQGAIALLLVAVASNLIVRRWPGLDPLLRERTVVMHHLLVGVPKAIAADPLRVAHEQQRQLARGLGRLFADGRDVVADATGLDAALETIDILREIGDLDHDAKLWLVRNQPALARLVDHPGLRAVASDTAVLDDVARVAEGSIAAAWRLGDRSDIQALFADPEIGAALAAIHLADLRAAWRARTAHGRPVPVAWRLGLGAGDGVKIWREQPEGLEHFASLRSDGRLIARGLLPGGDIARYRLVISGLESPQLLVDQRPCALIASAEGWSAEIGVEVPGSDVELSVLGDPPSAGHFSLVLSRR